MKHNKINTFLKVLVMTEESIKERKEYILKQAFTN